MLYIANDTHVTILNLKLEFLSSWNLSTSSVLQLKVDGNTLYLILGAFNKIRLCNSQDGKNLKEFGIVPGSKDGEFGYPCGLTVDNKYVFICDRNNHRIQILTKDNGVYISKWGRGIESTEQGQFSYPESIYHHLSEDLMYIGDRFSVQLFSKDGVCIQRLGDEEGIHMNQFQEVVGICVMDGRLYVGDCGNRRIQTFEGET